MTQHIRGVLCALAKRLPGALCVLWLAATLAFVTLQLLPIDAETAAVGGPGSQASAAALAAARAEFGLDKPLHAQYFDFLFRVINLDFGTSYAQRIPVTEVLKAAAAPTFALAAAAFALAWLLAAAALLAASGNSKIADIAARFLELCGAAVPNFWFASLMVLFFTGLLHILPPISNGTIAGDIMPLIALALPTAGYIAQSARPALYAAASAPHVEAARARGESEWGLRIRHILPHALVPALNMSAWSLGALLGGTAVVEIIFARPGLGRTLVNATISADVPVVLGAVLLIAAVYVLISLLTDTLVALIDPRTEARLNTGNNIQSPAGADA